MSDIKNNELISGVLLRDWFAGQVLPALLDWKNMPDIAETSDDPPDHVLIARTAYLIADAMIEARETGLKSAAEDVQLSALESVFLKDLAYFDELSLLTKNCLIAMEITSLGDLLRKTDAELLKFPNFKSKSLREVKKLLRHTFFC